MYEIKHGNRFRKSYKRILRECHISGDCILIYEIFNDIKIIRLYDIGNHANVFK